ncbi:MAG TPA: hypothetical protein VIU11_09520 [Nakamurella sp.]
MGEDNGTQVSDALGNVESMQVVDKAALLAGTAFGLKSVPIPGYGVIKVKPISRAQAMAAYEQEMPAAEMEQMLVSQACVEPTFTRSEVAAWQKVDGAGGNIFKLVNAILELSGMDVGAGKAAYKRFRGPA